MSAINAITPGARFGRWTALELVEFRPFPCGKKHPFRVCQCDCGTVQWVNQYNLLSGKTESCGCLQAEITEKRSLKHGNARRKKTTRAYRIWNGMIKRCSNSKMPSYKNYGGRGITVCNRWLDSFENFLVDMGEPTADLTLDRLDNDGSYCKENCAWRTPIDQARNRRNTIRWTFNGLTLTLSEWAEKVGISQKSLDARYRRGWSIERILTSPLDMTRLGRLTSTE
jgi:hypothetical protein